MNNINKAGNCLILCKSDNSYIDKVMIKYIRSSANHSLFCLISNLQYDLDYS